MPGDVYKLSFAYANNYNHTNPSSPALATVRITDTGSAADLVSPLIISHGSSTSTNLDWTVGGLTFAAIGPSSTLRFISDSPTPFGGILLDGVSVWINCDFTDDNLCNIDDLNAMLAVGPIAPGVPVTPGVNDQFDLTGDDVIDNADVGEWLAVAASENGFGSPYKLGDANLDGFVDGQDFILWNGSKFTSSLLWDEGEFNGDGFVDGQDLLVWNGNKFTSSDGATAVPEPGTSILSFVGLLLLGVARVRRCPI
jgi:hypothetical protein